jgi:hypothetical protein
MAKPTAVERKFIKVLKKALKEEGDFLLSAVATHIDGRTIYEMEATIPEPQEEAVDNG